jgi:putative transposase
LQQALEAGPAAYGWSQDQRWTLARIAEVIWELFSVYYTPAGAHVLLHRIGWSIQMTTRRAAAPSATSSPSGGPVIAAPR